MRHLRRLLPYLARHRVPLQRGTACLLLTTVLSVASPWVLRYAVDDLVVAVTRSKLALYAALRDVGLTLDFSPFDFHAQATRARVLRALEREQRDGGE